MRTLRGPSMASGPIRMSPSTAERRAPGIRAPGQGRGADGDGEGYPTPRGRGRGGGSRRCLARGRPRRSATSVHPRSFAGRPEGGRATASAANASSTSAWSAASAWIRKLERPLDEAGPQAASARGARPPGGSPIARQGGEPDTRPQHPARGSDEQRRCPSLTLGERIVDRGDEAEDDRPLRQDGEAEESAGSDSGADAGRGARHRATGRRRRGPPSPARGGAGPGRAQCRAAPPHGRAVERPRARGRSRLTMSTSATSAAAVEDSRPRRRGRGRCAPVRREAPRRVADTESHPSPVPTRPDDRRCRARGRRRASPRSPMGGPRAGAPPRRNRPRGAPARALRLPRRASMAAPAAPLANHPRGRGPWRGPL